MGWALWEGTGREPIEVGQDPNWAFVDELARGLLGHDPPGPGRAARLGRFRDLDLIVCEDFLLYPWLLRDGSLDFDGVETARIIGAIQLLTRVADIDFVLQGADTKDAAEAGGAAELFVRPLDQNRHANDAIRHGVFYIQTELLHPSSARAEGGRLVAGESPLQAEARAVLEARRAVPRA